MSTSLITPNSLTSGSSAGSTNSASTPSATSLGGTPSESTFLTLLVSQLKNQDPLNPTDSTQFVSELAQFSSLEQEIGINKNTSSLVSVLDPAAAGAGANAASGSVSAAASAAASQAASSAISNAYNTSLNSIG